MSLAKHLEVLGKTFRSVYAFSNSMVSRTFLNSLPGIKRGRTVLICVARTASAVSAPSELLFSQKLPKSPNSTIFPAANSCGMVVSRASSTAIVSALETVEISEIRAAICRRVLRPLDSMDG